MGEGLGGQLPFILLMFVVIIFFMVIPAQRRQKREKKFINSLKKGDKVITKSGLHAKILEINDKDNSCVLETMAGKLKFDRSAISVEASSRLRTPQEKK